MSCELNECLSQSEVPDSLHCLNRVQIKEEPEDYAETSTINDDNNLDDEGVRQLQELNGDAGSTEQQICAKSESDADIDEVSSDKVKQTLKLMYRCKYCGQQLKKIASLEKHEEAHRNGTIYKCRFCEYYSIDRGRIAAHECKHTGEKPFACDRCEFRCASKCDLSKHELVHATARPYQCKLCPFSAKSTASLQKHMRCHSDNRPFSCDVCDWKFKTKSALDNHRKLHSDLMGFFCDKCDYTCKTQNLLRQHAISHSQVRNYACSHPGCLQRCKTNSDLIKHISVHSTGLDFKCVLCNKLFKSRHSLISHTRRHEKREYPCKICGKVLRNSNSHRNHMLTLHLVGKKIECLICGHMFSSKINLRTHLKVHGADRPFRCPVCVQGFKTINHLFTHIGASHGKDYVYVCDICNRPFSRYMMMKFHIDRNHLDERDKDIVHKFIYDENCSAYDAVEFERKLTEMLKKPNSTATDLNYYLEDVKPDLEMNFLVDNYVKESLTSQSMSDASTNNLEGENASQFYDTNYTADSEHVLGGQSNHNDHGGCTKSKDRESTDFNDLGNKTKTLEIKLERIDESNVLLGSSNFEKSQNKSSQKCAQVIRLGSYANVSIKLAGKDSGVKFNMKKGKKCKGWFTHPDNMMPEAREKTINYWVKQADSAERKVCVKDKRKLKKKTVKKLKISIDKIQPVSKRVSLKGKGKKKKDSNSIEDSSTKDVIVKKKRKKKSNSSLSPKVLPDFTLAIKSEVPDSMHETTDQNHHFPIQQDNHVAKTETELHEQVFHQNDTRITHNIEVHVHDIIKHNQSCKNMPKVKRANGVRGRISTKVKKTATLLEKKKHQKSTISKKQKKAVKFLKSLDKNDVFCSTLGERLPQLKVVLPKLDGQLGILEQESEQLFRDQETSAILEVEKVVDSPLQITWKQVGGHKNSISYKRLLGSCSNSSQGQTLAVMKDLKGSDLELNQASKPTTSVTDNVESYPGLNTVTNEKDAPCDKKIKATIIATTQSLEKKMPPVIEPTDQLPIAVNGGASPMETKSKSVVRVVSLEEFEDEYKKRPKVVANVSLKSSHLKPVVQLTDILRKRKGIPLNGNRKKKRLIMKIQMNNVSHDVDRNPSKREEPVHNEKGSFEASNDYVDKIEHSVISEASVSFVEGSPSFNHVDDDGITNTDNALSLNGHDSLTFREFVEELKRNPEQFSHETFLTSKRKYKVKSSKKGGARKTGKTISTKGKCLSSKIDIALENEDIAADLNLDLNDSYCRLLTQGDIEMAREESQSHTSGKSPKEHTGKVTKRISKSQKVKHPEKQLANNKRGAKGNFKSTSNRKISHKIKVSALFGNTMVKKKKKTRVVGKLPHNEDPQNVEGSTSNNLQMTLSAIGSPKGKKLFKVDESNINFKMSPKISLNQKRKKNGEKNGILFDKRSNVDTGENRIKLPGLVSTDETERRLTVECVTLTPKVMIKNIEADDGPSHSTIFGAVDEDSQCIEGATLAPYVGEGIVKMEMEDVNSDIMNVPRNSVETVDLSLSLALYNNNCMGGSRNVNGVSVNSSASQCLEYSLKMEESQSHHSALPAIENIHNPVEATCESHVMNEGYLDPVDRECVDNDPTNTTSDLNVMNNDYSVSMDDSYLTLTYAQCDKSIMDNDYVNSVNVDLPLVKTSTSNVQTVTDELACVPLPPCPTNSEEIICTEALTEECDDTSLTVVVELGVDTQDVNVKKELPDD